MTVCNPLNRSMTTDHSPLHPSRGRCPFIQLLLVLSVSLGWRAPAETLTGTAGMPANDGTGPVLHVTEADIHDVIADAPPHAVIMADRNAEFVLEKGLEFTRPLTLIGLNARLPDGLGKTRLIDVRADGVTIRDFKLTGNVGSVPQNHRASLIRIAAEDFIVANGIMNHSSRHGVIVTAGLRETDIDGGLISNVRGDGNDRDLVSIESKGHRGLYVRNVTVRDVFCRNSLHRGAVEVCDGVRNIRIHNVYAESCHYGVDFQDHSAEAQYNHDVVIDGVFTRNCFYAVRTGLHMVGHSGLTIKNVVGREWRYRRHAHPLVITETRDVELFAIRIEGWHADQPAVYIDECDGLVVRDLVLRGTDSDAEAVKLMNSSNVVIDGLYLRENRKVPPHALLVEIRKPRPFRNLIVRNVIAPGSAVTLRNAEGGGGLTDYLITGNIVRVEDMIRSATGVIHNNLER